MTTHPDYTALLAAIDAGERFALALLCDWAIENMSPLADGLCALRDGGKWPHESYKSNWTFWMSASPQTSLGRRWVERCPVMKSTYPDGWHLSASDAIIEAALAYRPGEDA